MSFILRCMDPWTSSPQGE